MEGDFRGYSPRFSPGTKTHDRKPTAKRHSLAMPEAFGQRATDVEDPEQFIPGAFPENQTKQSQGLSEDESELPSKEMPSGSKVGVGSLPGNFREPGVATLPEERIDGRPYGHGHTGFEPTLGHGRTQVPNTSPSKSDPQASGGTTKSEEEATLNSAVHTGDHILEAMESTAAGIYHGVEHVLADVGEGAKAYMPNVGTYFGSGGGKPSERKVFSKQPSSDSDTSPMASKSDLSSMGQPNISNTLPNLVKREYCRSVEYDLDGEKLDTGIFLYENDFSSSSDNEDDALGEHHHRKKRHPRDPRDPAKPAKSVNSLDSRLSVDVVSGVGGVTFHRSAKEGNLPGYPTSEGMKQLISDRVKEDYQHQPGSGVITPDIEENYNQLPSEPALSDSEVDHRITEERWGLPVFVGGGSTATGRFEAILQPAPGQPDDIEEIPRFVDGNPTTGGKFEGISEPVIPRDKSTTPPRNTGTKTTNPFKGSSFETSMPNMKNIPSSSGPPSLRNRSPEEKKQVPIFASGASTASGKFETIFEPASYHPEVLKESSKFTEGKSTTYGEFRATSNSSMSSDEMPGKKSETPIFPGGGSISSGKVETISQPVTGRSEEPENHLGAVSGNPFTKSSSGQKQVYPGYLGKPMNDEEISSEVERARREFDRKLGLN